MTLPAPERLYRFVQFEFAWPLGPADGRYVLRVHAGEEPHRVLVLKTWPAGRPKGRRRRAREVEPEPEAAAHGICRATVVDTVRVDDDAARKWLRAAGDDEVADGLKHLNEALAAHRAAAADPAVREVGTADALVTRVGYGEGDQVADGRWDDAREVPAPKESATRRARREAALRPQERLAAILSGRDVVLACETLAIRARSDLDHGHVREAALQAHLALEAAVAELQAWRELRDLEERLGDLDAQRDALAAAANEALAGGLTDGTVETVRAGLERVEAALRARSASARF